jgi:hypothetical protein
MKPIITDGLKLKNGEAAFARVAAALIESKSVSMGYEGGSRGLSFRICKGVSYRVGAQRGNLVRQTQYVPVSTGTLTLTDKRAIYSGDSKSFSLALDTIDVCEIALDCLILGKDDKTRIIKCELPKAVHQQLLQVLSFRPSIISKRLFSAKKGFGFLKTLFIIIGLIVAAAVISAMFSK